MTTPQLKIAAHVVIQLGQELVTDMEQAFLEVVKNAYDADSETCKIFIDPEWKATSKSEIYSRYAGTLSGAIKDGTSIGKISITDTGDGASENAVTNGWLTISASLKRGRGIVGKVKTKKSRTPVGDKGLGRLATMKMGDLLVFRTSIEGEQTERVTWFSWSDCSGKRTIDEVPVFQRNVQRPPPYSGGSTVEIIGLHNLEQWDSKARIDRLVARLSQLINPYFPIKDFDIEIHDLKNKRVLSLQEIGKSVLNFAAAEFHFEWDGSRLKKTALIAKSLFRGTTGDGSKEKYDEIFSAEHAGALDSMLLNSKRLRNRNVSVRPSKEWLCSYEESDSFEDIPKIKSTPVECGPFSGKFYYFLFNETFKNKVSANAASSEQVQEMSGIQVFRDGFRVRLDTDWIGLGSGTTTGNYYALRPKNTLGFFLLGNESNSSLVEKSDREGFVENAALDRFKLLTEECKKYANEILQSSREDMNEFYKSLDPDSKAISTPKQALARLKDSQKQALTGVHRAKAATTQTVKKIQLVRDSLSQATKNNLIDKSIIKDLDSVLAEVNDLGLGLSSIQDRVSQIDKASDAVDGFRASQSQLNLRLLESAAIGLTARVLSHEISAYTDTLEMAVTEIAEENKKKSNTVITRSIKLLSGTLKELRKVITSINPLLPGSRAVKESLPLTATINDFYNARFTAISNCNIGFKITGDDGGTCLRFSRTRFYQILENLLQNSIYWIEHATEENAGQRLIRVAITPSGFQWWDSGDGVVEKYENSLFDAFITNKPRNDGQGLGLYIVSTFLEAEKCSVILLPVRNKKGRRFKFELDLSAARIK